MGRGRKKTVANEVAKGLRAFDRRFFARAIAATRNGNGEQRRGRVIWRVFAPKKPTGMRKERGDSFHDDPSFGSMGIVLSAGIAISDGDLREESSLTVVGLRRGFCGRIERGFGFSTPGR